MDNEWKSSLREEALALGFPLSEDALEKLAAHVDLLLRWNSKVNLTAITQRDEVRIKHVLDSLCGLALVPDAAVDVLDLGSGAGFPGIPWMCARPGLRVTMVDSVGKKVGFLKNAVAQLKLPGRGHQARLEGHPEAEGLTRAEVVVGRAFVELGELLALAPRYLVPTGVVVAMLGQREGAEEVSRLVEAAGFRLDAEREFELPSGMGRRRVIRAVPRGTVTAG